MPDFAPPWTPQQVLQFKGTLNDLDEPRQKESFTVLAGTGGPTVTAGWTKVSNIDRARRLGFTMPVGYDPAAMDIPIWFDASVSYGKFGWTAADIELNIQKLEWMAGRGKLYANGTHPAHGTPPIVQITSFNANRHATALIPPNFHSDQPSDLRWLISNLQYDQNSYRAVGGDRLQQAVTVSVVQYVAAPGAPAGPRERQRSRGTSSGYKSFTTTDAVDTIAKVCVHFGINNRSKWRDVLAFNQKRLKVTSYNKILKRGTVVHVPKADF